MLKHWTASLALIGALAMASGAAAEDMQPGTPKVTITKAHVRHPLVNVNVTVPPGTVCKITSCCIRADSGHVEA
jgi:hypothetical protein